MLSAHSKAHAPYTPELNVCQEDKLNHLQVTSLQANKSLDAVN